MNGVLKKTVSVILSAIMLLSVVPLAEVQQRVVSPFGAEASAAAADKRTNGHITGIITDWEPAIILNGTGDTLVGTLEIDGHYYAVKDTNLISPERADKYVSEATPVVLRIMDGCVTDITLLTEEITSLLADAAPVTIEYSGNNKFWKKKKAEITAAIENKKVSDTWSQGDKNSLEAWLRLYELSSYDNVFIELRSPDKEKLFFRNNFSDSTFTQLEVSEKINAGDRTEVNADIYVNTAYQPEKGEEEIPVEFTLFEKTETDSNIITTGEFTVRLVNTDYEAPPEFERISVYELLTILEAGLDGYHPKKLGEKGFLTSSFTAAGIGENLTNLQGVYDSFDMLKVGIDVNNMICRADINGLIFEATDAYMSALFNQIEEEAKTLSGYTDSAIERLISSEAFRDYVEWYEKNYGYLNGYYTIAEVKCPTNVTVTDEDGSPALTITDGVITVFDESIYAVTENGEKLFYLPTSIDYKIEITATDDGTMDYIISSVTPGGIERTITYNDVPLTKGEAYNATIPCDIFSETEAFDLINGDGEATAAYSDTLPPVTSNAADVIIAEELFSDFPVEIITKVADALINMEASVDLSDADLCPGDAAALFSAISKKYPVEYSLITNGDFSYSIVYDTVLNKITEIRFEYGKGINREALLEKAAALKEKINSIIEKTEGMDDFGKALYIHDYIVLNCRYDTELLSVLEADGSLTGELRTDRYSEYSVLINGTGICGSYALAYRALMNAAGAECLYVSSSAMNHAWNLVKLDGEWYHVDCCWDDPVPDREGSARRTYFLRTDKEIMALQHHSWTPSQHKATDEKYSSMQRLSDNIQKYDSVNDCWYYIAGGKIYRTDRYGKEQTLITEKLNAVSVATDGGALYYSVGKNIYQYNISSDKSTPVYIMPLYDKEGNYCEEAELKNIYVEGNDIYGYKKASIYEDIDGEYQYVDKILYFEDVKSTEIINSAKGVYIEYTEMEIELFTEGYNYAYIEADIPMWDYEVTWTSSDESIVSVDRYGTVYAHNMGTVTITAAFLDFTASCTVTVTPPAGSSEAVIHGSYNSAIRWSFDKTTKVLTISGTGKMPDYSHSTQYDKPWSEYEYDIEEIIVGSGITDLGYYAFSNCYYLKRATLPEGLSEICYYAFSGCQKLENVNIPSTVRKIDYSAFSTCMKLKDVVLPEGLSEICDSAFALTYALEKIEIPSGVKTISACAFNSSGIKELILHEGLETIEREAFSNCNSLREMNIPSSVTSLDYSGIYGGRALERITVAEGNRYFSSDEYGVLFDYSKENLIHYPAGSAHKEYSVPTSVKEISRFAFLYSSVIERVILPEGLTTIGYGAFMRSTALKEIEIPSSVTITDEEMFGECTALRTAVFKNSPAKIPSKTFYNCKNLVSVNIPKSVRTIGYCAFYNCEALTHVGIEGSSVPDADQQNSWLTDAAFVHCNFTSDCISDKSEKPSCLKDGTEGAKYCSVCDCSFGGFTVPATGHNYTVTASSEGSCTEAPYTEFTCTGCNDTYTETGSISGGHRYEASVISPTCTAPGYTLKECTVCKETVISDFIFPEGHSLTLKNNSDFCENHGTCTYYCSKCDYKETLAVNEAQLTVNTVITDASCTESGTKKEICTLCGATVKTELLSPTGHLFSESWTIDKEASFGEKGEKSRHCTKCDARIDVTEFEAEPCPHTDTELINKKPATCKDEGYTGDTVCRCGVTVKYGEIIPKTDDHTGGTATCIESAVCTVCKEHYGEADPDNHTEIFIEITNPSCTEDGLTDGIICSLCDKAIKEQKKISATGHLDADGDYYCDFGCGKEYPKPDSPENNCTHFCHKGGIYRIFNMVMKIIRKLFGVYPVCSCGEAHY